ncbi:MAG: N-acylglucosamine 2-epimerase [Aeromicrobium sp.]|jgi:hypothetical protein|nr:N-acylglucosamine 2-epimerase [Aeromicrobium sp.]
MPNRLADATSPYLQQHADNPVDWWEWSPEALELARTLDRPILLSVGYAACHWCDVTNRTLRMFLKTVKPQVRGAISVQISSRSFAV